MANSTKTKAKPESKATTNEDVMKHIIGMTESMGYVIDTLKTHADMLKEQQDIVIRLRTRMGL